MSHIDRRRVLTSLAGSAAIAATAPAISKAALAVPNSGVLDGPDERLGWLIAQRDARECGQHTVDFWSMNWAHSHFAKHLPPQISRGLVAYHDFGARISDGPTALNPWERALEDCARKWIEPKELDRLTLKLDVGPEDFLSRLTAFVGEKGIAVRAALIDLDSNTFFGGDTTRWRSMLPAFTRCYDFIIGLCHFEQRGLHQERAYLDASFDESHFADNVLEPASLCDAVIVTSAGLIETDPGLCPRASTEDLVGELVRRLGYALLEPKIRDRIAGTGAAKKTKPRFFALGSATLNAPFDPILHLQMMLDRQSTFISGSFAPLATDELPLFIATSTNDDRGLWTHMMDTLAYITLNSGYARRAETLRAVDLFCSVAAPRYRADAVGKQNLNNTRDWFPRIVSELATTLGLPCYATGKPPGCEGREFLCDFSAFIDDNDGTKDDDDRFWAQAAIVGEIEWSVDEG